MMSRFVLLFLFCFAPVSAVDVDFLRSWNERALVTAKAYEASIVREGDEPSFVDPLEPIAALFQPLETLGSGSRSMVLLRSGSDHRLFAVKQTEMTVEQVAELQHELGIGLNLQHPTFVKIYNAVLKTVSADSEVVQAYLFMECAPGLRLADDAVEEAERRVLLQQYLDGVIHALDRKIVPYGIHGGNVLVAPAKITLVDLQLYQWMEDTRVSCLDFFDEIGYVVHFLQREEGDEELAARRASWRTVFKQDNSFSRPLTLEQAALLRECLLDLQQAAQL